MTGAPQVEVPWNEAMMKVLDVQFNMSSSYNGWNIALNLMASGKVNVEPMIGVRPLREWEEAMADLEAGKACRLQARGKDRVLFPRRRSCYDDTEARYRAYQRIGDIS